MATFFLNRIRQLPFYYIAFSVLKTIRFETSWEEFALERSIKEDSGRVKVTAGVSLSTLVPCSLYSGTKIKWWMLLLRLSLKYFCCYSRGHLPLVPTINSLLFTVKGKELSRRLFQNLSISESLNFKNDLLSRLHLASGDVQKKLHIFFLYKEKVGLEFKKKKNSWVISKSEVIAHSK